MTTTKHAQNGVFLLEALIGILIFSLGILALVAMGASAIAVQTDAQFRAEAMNLAERISSDIWTGVDRTKQVIGGAEMSVVTAASLSQYQHMENGSDCTFTGTASGRTEVADWLNAVAATLPGSAVTGINRQQILVSTANNNQVRITICWQAPRDTKVRQYTLVTYVN